MVSSEPPPVPVVCLAVVDPGGALLATQRPHGKRLGGLWELPGGKVEPGEEPRAALCREIAEELTLTLPDGELEALPPSDFAYPFGRVRLLPFRWRAPCRPVIHLTEHIALQWVRPQAWRELSWAPADIPILDRLEGVTANR